MVARAKALAVIPARGGSKSIPRKNIRLLEGHPLIAYSIAAARTASLIERVVVSTDDLEIARIAADWGADVPFLRPAELAGDSVGDLPVFAHALQSLEKSENYKPDIVVQLRPTSPVRPRGAVDGAVRLLLDNPTADSVRSIVPSSQNPYKMWRIREGWLKPLVASRIREAYNAPRQALPPTFWQTGQIDVIRRETILGKDSMSGDFILPFLMDPLYAVDLDTIDQWAIAELLIRRHGKAIVLP